MKPHPHQAYDFLRAIHPDDTPGETELRILAGKITVTDWHHTVPPARWIAELQRQYPKGNIYVGIAKRKDRTSGGKANCSGVYVLWCDIDFKDLPEAEARALIAACPLSPSIIVATGGGLHVYWFLIEPLDAVTDQAAIESYLRRLAVYCQADSSCAEVARILRVPGTVNHKYDPPRPVVLETLETDRCYNPSDFDEWLPADPEVFTSEDLPVGVPGEGVNTHNLPDRLRRAAAYLAHVPGAVQGDHGDEHTYVVACRLVRDFALDAGEAFTLLGDWNATCQPPWSERELQQKIEHALKYGEGAIGSKLLEDRPRQSSASGTSTGSTASQSSAAAGSSEAPEANGRRCVILTAASTISVRPVRWLRENSIALGTLSLLGGREGIGKSIYAYSLAADITRGMLAGACEGTPRDVIVAATEDSWEHTIVPRLMAAGADLARVHRAEVLTSDGIESTLTLPIDLTALAEAVREVQAVLILLDPLMSRLDAALDSHKDHEVRIALEPLVKLAGATDAAVLGILHVNKGTSADPLTLLMGSRAFAAVARSVLFIMTDPDDDTQRLLGQPKNNLGRTDLPTLKFTIQGIKVADTPEGEVWTGRLEWLGESDRSIREAIVAAAESSGERSASREAADWLHDYLSSQAGRAQRKTIMDAGKNAGHSNDALRRAREYLKLTTENVGYPRQTYWQLPVVASSRGNSRGETSNTHTTATTETSGGSGGSRGIPPDGTATTGRTTGVAA